MTDLIFRDVDEDTLARVLEALQGASVEIHTEPARGQWTTAIAADVLSEAVPRATKLVRAVIDAGGQISVDAAREQTGEQQLHHMVQSLTSTTRRLSPRHSSSRNGLPRPLDPLRERGNQGRVIGYRMSANAVEAFAQAMAQMPAHAAVSPHGAERGAAT